MNSLCSRVKNNMVSQLGLRTHGRMRNVLHVFFYSLAKTWQIQMQTDALKRSKAQH